MFCYGVIVVVAKMNPLPPPPILHVGLNEGGMGSRPYRPHPACLPPARLPGVASLRVASDAAKWVPAVPSVVKDETERRRTEPHDTR